VDVDEALAVVLQLLPDVPGVERFVPLVEDDLGACTEPRDGEEGHAASFRTLTTTELRACAGAAVPDGAQERITRTRQALSRAGLDGGRVAWHLAECHRCAARRVRPAIVVRRRIGGPSAVVEREYGVGAEREAS
jgi:hypothetical protein